MNLIRERDKAMLKARQAAYEGNGTLAQSWIDRANQFWPVSDRQASNVQKFLDLAQRIGKGKP